MLFNLLPEAGMEAPSAVNQLEKTMDKVALSGNMANVLTHSFAQVKNEYRMALLDESYLPQIMVLQEVILQGLSRPDLLEPFPKDFMQEHIGIKGQIVGAFSGSELVAFRNVYFPEKDDREWNLGIDLDIRKDELDKVANLQMVCVHPRHRGHHLAFKMNGHVIRALKKLRTHYHLCATVSPYNYWNIRILLNCGFVVRALKTKYGDKLRYIVYHDLRQPMHFSSRTETTLALTDIRQQKKLMAQGYRGIALKEISGFQARNREDLINGFELVFAKPLK